MSMLVADRPSTGVEVEAAEVALHWFAGRLTHVGGRNFALGALAGNLISIAKDGRGSSANGHNGGDDEVLEELHLGFRGWD